MKKLSNFFNNVEKEREDVIECLEAMNELEKAVKENKKEVSKRMRDQFDYKRFKLRELWKVKGKLRRDIEVLRNEYQRDKGCNYIEGQEKVQQQKIAELLHRESAHQEEMKQFAGVAEKLKANEKIMLAYSKENTQLKKKTQELEKQCHDLTTQLSVLSRAEDMDKSKKASSVQEGLNKRIRELITELKEKDNVVQAKIKELDEKNGSAKVAQQKIFGLTKNALKFSTQLKEKEAIIEKLMRDAASSKIMIEEYKKKALETQEKLATDAHVGGSILSGTESEESKSRTTLSSIGGDSEMLQIEYGRRKSGVAATRHYYTQIEEYAISGAETAFRCCESKLDEFSSKLSICSTLQQTIQQKLSEIREETALQYEKKMLALNKEKREIEAKYKKSVEELNAEKAKVSDLTRSNLANSNMHLTKIVATKTDREEADKNAKLAIAQEMRSKNQELESCEGKAKMLKQKIGEMSQLVKKSSSALERKFSYFEMMSVKKHEEQNNKLSLILLNLVIAKRCIESGKQSQYNEEMREKENARVTGELKVALKNKGVLEIEITKLKKSFALLDAQKKRDAIMIEELNLKLSNLHSANLLVAAEKEEEHKKALMRIATRVQSELLKIKSKCEKLAAHNSTLAHIAEKAAKAGINILKEDVKLIAVRENNVKFRQVLAKYENALSRPKEISDKFELLELRTMVLTTRVSFTKSKIVSAMNSLRAELMKERVCSNDRKAKLEEAGKMHITLQEEIKNKNIEMETVARKLKETEITLESLQTQATEKSAAAHNSLKISNFQDVSISGNKKSAILQFEAFPILKIEGADKEILKGANKEISQDSLSIKIMEEKKDMPAHLKNGEAISRQAEANGGVISSSSEIADAGVCSMQKAFEAVIIQLREENKKTTDENLSLKGAMHDLINKMILLQVELEKLRGDSVPKASKGMAVLKDAKLEDPSTNSSQRAIGSQVEESKFLNLHRGILNVLETIPSK